MSVASAAPPAIRVRGLEMSYIAGPFQRSPVTSPTSALRRRNHVAAVLMLIAASMAALASTGTVPVLFVAPGLLFTVVAFFFAIRAQSVSRSAR